MTMTNTQFITLLLFRCPMNRKMAFTVAIAMLLVATQKVPTTEFTNKDFRKMEKTDVRTIMWLLLTLSLSPLLSYRCR